MRGEIAPLYSSLATELDAVSKKKKIYFKMSTHFMFVFYKIQNQAKPIYDAKVRVVAISEEKGGTAPVLGPYRLSDAGDVLLPDLGGGYMSVFSL